MRKGPSVADARSSKVLEDVMAWVRVHGTVFFQATLCAPWGFTVPKLKNATFHLWPPDSVGSKETPFMVLRNSGPTTL